ncbi:hypothetical protein J3Q64DRAFT_1878031 [Phycomyces blakesleeanus]|uniref:Uncharacterized protein n=2 Tax=Phycomyces blakesleeanus TaxID=4837 RepID=A0A163DHS1_PHYB8|nr:hypothetical protein PHYBLDRAFT_170680 [Phycomyces blakesleeanus NRRL 1555(-)]OAD71310.1 hypothetical protein PHYBLDRAFT_170680 [Phycomyces blakesleeanus NRRL 1555(-)]|eukprot:XP_018289350.1 hypothetical protein PHYBLDRAFT_170680 [Phycomyces blakesleeanus NRRL 1555(-)]
MPIETKNTKVVWGFMLENTYFMEFDHSNHAIIELAYRQRRSRQASHYITIRDSNLPSPARVYFGVAQVHLRMPGTRYYVKRRVLKVSTPASTRRQVQTQAQSLAPTSVQAPDLAHAPILVQDQDQAQTQAQSLSLAIAATSSSSPLSLSSSSSFSSSPSSSLSSASSSCLPSPISDPILSSSSYEPFPTQLDPAFEAMLWSGDLGWSLQTQAFLQPQQPFQSYPQLYNQPPLSLLPPHLPPQSLSATSATDTTISAPVIQNQYLSANIETPVERLLWDQWFESASAQDVYRTPFSTAQLDSYTSLLPY